MALAYAVLAAALSMSSLYFKTSVTPWELNPGFIQLLMVAIIAIAAAMLPFLQEGFKVVFREAMSRGRKIWKQALIAALLQTLLLMIPFILLIAIPWQTIVKQLPSNSSLAPQLTGAHEEPPMPFTTETQRSGSEPRLEESRIQEGSEPSITEHALTFAIATLLASLAATVAYSAYAVLRETKLPRSVEESAGTMEDSQALLAATEKAIIDVGGGVDPRWAVVSYFLKLCRVLEEKGIKVHDDMTAREIARLTLESFPSLRKYPLEKLVEMFEKARYSSHEVSERMREEALKCFIELREGLAGAARTLP